MKHIVFIHGSYSNDSGDSTIDQLKNYMPNYNILEADYGFTGIFGSLFFNSNFAEIVANLTPFNCIGLAHSNGCEILLNACKFNTKFKVLVLINPSLNSTATIFPKHLSNIFVFHNPYDIQVKTSFLFSRKWGGMGQYGYQGDDKRVTNIDTYELFNVKGHTEIFTKAPQQLAKYLDHDLNLKNFCSGCGRFS